MLTGQDRQADMSLEQEQRTSHFNNVELKCNFQAAQFTVETP